VEGRKLKTHSWWWFCGNPIPAGCRRDEALEPRSQGKPFRTKAEGGSYIGLGKSGEEVLLCLAVDEMNIRQVMLESVKVFFPEAEILKNLAPNPKNNNHTSLRII
jgi:hypothetical protein